MKILDFAPFSERILFGMLFALIPLLIAGTVVLLAQYVLAGCIDAPSLSLLP